MKEYVNFDVGCPQLAKGYMGGGLLIESKKAFHRIAQLIGQGPSSKNPAFLVVNVENDHPSLREVYQIIEQETGRLPSPTRIIRRNDSEKYFYARVYRIYENQDLQTVKYLNLHCSCLIADFLTQTHDECYVAKTNFRLKLSVELGRLSPFPAYAMANRIKDIFKGEMIKGFLTRPVLFDRPDNADKKLWQVWSEVVMPRCLLPLVDNNGEPTAPDNLANPIEHTDRPRIPGKAVHYDDGPYQPEELQYRASEVEALGEFDVAVAAERVGNFLEGAFRPVIISQRVRQILQREKLPGLQYVPVRLIP